MARFLISGLMPSIMKRWAIFTVLLYALALMLLTVPVITLAFGDWASNAMSVRDALGIFTEWGYWIWLAVLLAGQSLLLLLPISLAERRLPARRPLKTPVIVSAFFLASLVMAGVSALLCAGIGDDGMEVFNYLAPLVADPNHADGWSFIGSVLVTLLLFWLIWAIVFRHYSRNDEPEALLKRSTRWLLCGSILELLVAVPSHVIVRRRDDCCAPLGTFWGIATGLSVMLLCFGPGVYFLFVKRMEKLRAKNNPANPLAK